ncbi:hypothetical protein ACIRD9_07815 [Streptomyces violaceus]
MEVPPDGVMFDATLLTQGRAEWLREVGLEPGGPLPPLAGLRVRTSP